MSLTLTFEGSGAFTDFVVSVAPGARGVAADLQHEAHCPFASTAREEPRHNRSGDGRCQGHLHTGMRLPAPVFSKTILFLLEAQVIAVVGCVV